MSVYVPTVASGVKFNVVLKKKKKFDCWFCQIFYVLFGIVLDIPFQI